DTVRSSHQEALDPIAETINYILEKCPTARYPRDEASLYSLLANHGVRLSEMTDPWGNHYRPEFDVRGAAYYIAILSDGPDERKHATTSGLNLPPSPFPILPTERNSKLHWTTSSTIVAVFPSTPASWMKSFGQIERTSCNCRIPGVRPTGLCTATRDTARSLK